MAEPALYYPIWRVILWYKVAELFERGRVYYCQDHETEKQETLKIRGKPLDIPENQAPPTAFEVPIRQLNWTGRARRLPCGMEIRMTVALAQSFRSGTRRLVIKSGAAVTLVCLVFANLSSRGSLLITLYHNNCLYLASDSRSAYYGNGKRGDDEQKAFGFSTNCCAALTGFAGYDITNDTGEVLFSARLPRALGRVCAEEITNEASLEKKMQVIATRLNEEYAATLTMAPEKHEATRLQFCGYNPEKGSFFLSSCILTGTNSLQIELAKEYGQPGDYNVISVQGEANFLTALFSGKEPTLTNLMPPEFSDTAVEIVTTSSGVSDERVKNFILEMFRLHVENAARMGYDTGWVGPPYRIFKITKEKVIDLAPIVEREESKAISPKGGDNAADDQAIEAVMAKLEQSFKGGDYTYAIEVMYSPFVEQMGGKDKGIEAAKAMGAQAKQQQIEVVSWKTKKPYTYIEGTSRTYAVIPYKSVMIISGKKVNQESYQLGIKSGDGPWQFCNGDTLSPEIYKNFFPDFPKAFELPKVRRFFD